jgi:hypothetical protein
MSSLDRRIARLEQTMVRTEMEAIARMTREQRDQCMIEILTPYIGEKKARAHVDRLRTDPAYCEEHRMMLAKLGQREGILPWQQRFPGAHHRAQRGGS